MPARPESQTKSETLQVTGTTPIRVGAVGGVVLRLSGPVSEALPGPSMPSALWLECLSVVLHRKAVRMHGVSRHIPPSQSDNVDS